MYMSQCHEKDIRWCHVCVIHSCRAPSNSCRSEDNPQASAASAKVREPPLPSHSLLSFLSTCFLSVFLSLYLFPLCFPFSLLVSSLFSFLSTCSLVHVFDEMLSLLMYVRWCPPRVVWLRWQGRGRAVRMKRRERGEELLILLWRFSHHTIRASGLPQRLGISGR